MDVTRRVVLLAVLLLATGFFAALAAEEPAGLPNGKAILHATVLDDQRRALPGVVVCLKNERGILLSVTDEDGVSVLEVPGGEYSLTSQLEGFDTQRITGIRIIEEKELELDVILHETEGDYITNTGGEAHHEC